MAKIPVLHMGNPSIERTLRRLNTQGLINQGWEDSWAGVNFADGTLAEPPIALCEVQAYVYSAYASGAWMAHDAGNTALADELTDRAAQLKTVQ